MRPSKNHKKFWENRPVFITGVTGFVGGNLAARLVREGAEVVGLIRDDVAASNFRKLELAKKITGIYGDLEDYACIERIINEYSIQYLYHLGAQAIVSTANRSPLSTFNSNIRGTWNLLEACRGKESLKSIIIASSDKAYGTHKKLPYREDFALKPESPYDTSKACAELIAQAYYKTYGLPIVVTRFSNIYGPGDLNFSRIIPDTIQNLLQDRAPIIRSDGTPKRDYLYIDDAVDLYILLAEEIEKIRGEIFNAGHNAPISVLKLVEKLIRISGKNNLRPQILTKGRLHGEINHQWLDGRKVKRVLGWRPQVKLDEGLVRSYQWYKRFLGSSEPKV